MAKGIKTGGRKAGTPNKRTSILEKCEAESFDPFAAMIQIAKNESHERRFDAVKELCQYIEPKKKAVEVSGGLDLRLQQELEALAGLSEEELRKLLKEELAKS